jgi:dolichol-phosphate mannosyltransferase
VDGGAAAVAMKLSVVIPAHNEQASIRQTVEAVTERLDAEDIAYEVVVVDDASTDHTPAIIAELAEADPHVRYVRSPYRNGFGFAVRAGLEVYTGDAVAIMMADLSDHPDDLVSYYRLLLAGYDCAFGSRFMPGGRVEDYPTIKLILNRIANLAIRVLFGHGYDDTTNAFKAYRREVIDNVQPLLSQHFNLTVEIPLKAIIRGHSYAITPVRWTNRQAGESKLRLQEMGGRYAFIVLYAFFEYHLSRGDYRRPDESHAVHPGRWRAGRPGARVIDDPAPPEEPRPRSARG